MGTNAENYSDSNTKPAAFRVARINQPTPFVVRWRALQHELAFKTGRLDCFITEISKIVAIPRRRSDKSSAVSPRFRKSFLSNSMAS